MDDASLVAPSDPDEALTIIALNHCTMPLGNRGDLTADRLDRGSLAPQEVRVLVAFPSNLIGLRHHEESAAGPSQKPKLDRRDLAAQIRKKLRSPSHGTTVTSASLEAVEEVSRLALRTASSPL
jgi:hypothetical protein